MKDGQSAQTVSGIWKIARDVGNRGREERWYDGIHKEAKPAPVSGIIQQVFPDYHGVAWYWTTFRLPRAVSAAERALLKFGAVDYLAEVWVNGQPVGGHFQLNGRRIFVKSTHTGNMVPIGQQGSLARLLSTVTEDHAERGGFSLPIHAGV